MNHPELHTVTATNGPRPAGPPDKCCYCREPIGGTHQADCVMRQRSVRMRFSFDVIVFVPESWTVSSIEFRYGEGSWCADNALDLLTAYTDQPGYCLCPLFTSQYLGEATAEEDAAWVRLTPDAEKGQ